MAPFIVIHAVNQRLILRIEICPGIGMIVRRGDHFSVLSEFVRNSKGNRSKDWDGSLLNERLAGLVTKGYYLHWDGPPCLATAWARGRKWSRVFSFTGKDFLERHVLALELLRIS
jgi:hypothetical protein